MERELETQKMEDWRSQVLSRYQNADPQTQAALDGLTELAAHICQTPVALIAFVERDRQWFKSSVGSDVREVPLDVGFVPLTVEQKSKLIIPDASVDPRYARNPAVFMPGIRAYAGIPLIAPEGCVLGALCAIDLVPRQFSLEQIQSLEMLARQVMMQLEQMLVLRKSQQTDRTKITPAINATVEQGVSELERQQSEAIRRESELKLRLILESFDLGELGLHLTKNTHYKRKSSKNDEIFGNSSLLTDWNYQIFLKYVHPDDRAFVEEQFQKTFTDYGDWGFQCRIVRGDGAIRWIWALGSVYHNLKVIPVRLLGIAIDITDRKKSEADLRESEWRFRQVVESKVFGVLFGDARGAIHYANEYILKLLGYTAAEILSGNVQWNRLTPPEFADRDAMAIAQLRKEGVCQPYEKAYVRKDGSRIPVLVTAAMLEQPFSQQQEAVAFILDLTELKRVQEERDRFFSLSIDMLAIANFDGYFIHLNPSWEKTLGWTETELMETPFIEFVHPEDKERTLKEVKKLSQGEDTIQFENRYLTKDGSYRWLAWNSATVIEHKIVYAVARDITERKAVEEAREQLLISEQNAREAAEQANRIKDEFLAVVSHELRTPLNPILGWSKLLQQGRLNPTRTAEAIATIERNAKLQVQLIDDLLDISRILRGKLSLEVDLVPLDTVIAAASDTVRLAAEAKSIEMQVSYPESSLAVSGDAGRLQQVVWNLLSNAVKFTPNGGRIEISLSQIGEYDEKSLPCAQIKVKDTGKGIHPEFLPYVFEHFRQEDAATTRRFGGLGLGLAIVKQIVELHGGNVKVESEGEGLGATFTIQIPLADKSANVSISPSSEISANNLNGIVILVIDDESDTRQLMTFVLEEANATVISVASGKEALAAIALSVPDLVISDIGMSEMDGYMLMREIRQLPLSQGGSLKAIALTAYAGESDRSLAMAAGFQRHLPKPIDPDLLIATVIDLAKP